MKSFLFPFLYPVSLIVRLVTSLDRRFRSRHAVRLDAAVFSVGNLTVGGTGKTPWVIKLVKDLQSLGQTPAVLTRGYKGVGRGSGADSDEVLLMAEKCPDVPLGVGPDRKGTAREIQDRIHPSAFVLDDGFQHWPLKRDVDIVCVDVTDPWGGGCLIPCGRLREPLVSVRRADAIVLTRCDLVSPEELSDIEKRIRTISPSSEVFQSRFSSTLWSVRGNVEKNPTELYGKRVLAVSGLGHPHGFETALEHFGAIVTPMRFRDHHRYSAEDVAAIERMCQSTDSILVTTEKDWVKLRTMKLSGDGFVVRIFPWMDRKDEQRWINFLKNRIDEAKTSR